MKCGIPITPLDNLVAEKSGAAEGRVDLEQLARYQLARINETIERSRRMSPFYRRHLGRCSPGGIERLADLAAYPFVTADDVAAHGLQMMCLSQSHISRVVTMNTSGTTGNPKRLFFTSFEQQATIDFFERGMSTFVDPGDKVLIMLPGERSGSVGDLLRQALPHIGATPVPYGLVEQAPAAVRRMRSEQVACLVGLPVQVLAMARYCEWNDEEDWAPRVVLLSSDHVPPPIVRTLKRIWGCDVYEHYGMTEMGLGGGIECAAHDGYHMRESDLYFEIVDPDSNRPLPDGEYGEVVFTTLTRAGMPLIRYRTGDISRFIPAPCRCGSVLRRLERVKCRKDGVIQLGGQPLALADLDAVLFALPDVVDFSAEVAYGPTTRLSISVSFAPEASGSDLSAIWRALRRVPAIYAAEQQAGRLALAVNAVSACPVTRGKRRIQIGQLELPLKKRGIIQARVP